MADYVSVSVANDAYKCAVSLAVSALQTTLEGFDGIAIKRRKNGTQTYTTLYTKDIDVIGDATFTALDILAVSGTSYDYSIEVLNGSTVVETHSAENVSCEFDGLFVGNFSAYYIAGLNISNDTEDHTDCEFVTTLASQYPYKVSNSVLDYVSGSSSGLFLPLTADKRRFVPDDDHTYTDSVMAFLKDKTAKILKTYDGKIYYIGIDKTVKRVANNGYRGMNSVQFSWTEIGSVPTTGLYIES